MKVFCIEILGENAFHPFLLQSGWSGKDYPFFYNPATGSHMRAYREIEAYRAERVDLHKSANIWPILGNVLDASEVAPHLFVDAPPVEVAMARRPGKGGPRCP